MTGEQPECVSAFDALGHEVRVGILRALVAHHRDRASDEPVGFADLRTAVGVRDSGRFRYHLQELLGTFVEQADDGYRLTTAGVRVTAAILAGTFSEEPRLGPTELESDCPTCGAQAVGRYEGGVVHVACERDHPLFVWSVPPNAASESTVPELVDVATILVRRAIDLARAGTCPQCYGPVEPHVEFPADQRGVAEPDDADGERDGNTDVERSDCHAGEERSDGRPDEHDTGHGGGEVSSDGRSASGDGGDRGGSSIRFRAECETCGGRLNGPIGFCLLSDPSVRACFRRRGRPLRECDPWDLAFVRDEAVTHAAGEAAVRIDVDGGSLSAFLDERGRVLEVDESSP